MCLDGKCCLVFAEERFHPRSPAKLVEMGEQFRAATAATASADQDGAGQAAATRELADLLLAPEGSTLQVRPLAAG